MHNVVLDYLNYDLRFRMHQHVKIKLAQLEAFDLQTCAFFCTFWATIVSNHLLTRISLFLFLCSVLQQETHGKTSEGLLTGCLSLLTSQMCYWATLTHSSGSPYTPTRAGDTGRDDLRSAFTYRALYSQVVCVLLSRIRHW